MFPVSFLLLYVDCLLFCSYHITSVVVGFVFNHHLEVVPKFIHL